MTWKNKLAKEAVWLLLTILGSLLLWCFLTITTDQNIIVTKYLYTKELGGLLITIGYIYFVRLSKWATG